MVIWITGLPGAGKTTFACKLSHSLKKSKISSIKLDGDNLRQIIGSTSKEDYDFCKRKRLSKIYSKLAANFSAQGFVVLVSTVSLFSEIRHWNRYNIPKYLEVFLDTPIEILRKRDQKKIYSKKLFIDNSNISKKHNYELPKKSDFVFKNFNHKQIEIIKEEIIKEEIINYQMILGENNENRLGLY